MKRFITYFLILVSAFSYGQNKGIIIGTFGEKQTPKEIEGCSSFFYLSESDKKLNKYLYVNDFAQTSFIKVNNQLVKFTLIKNYPVGKTDVYLYKNGKTQLKVEVKTKKATGDENMVVTGTMTVQDQYGKKIALNFIGNSGC